MTSEPMQAWLDAHTTIFDVLGAGVTELATAAGAAGDAVGTRGPDRASSELLTVRQRATTMLSLLAEAGNLPHIPDGDTNRHFHAGLNRWKDAARTITEAADRRDAAELKRSARALDAGTEEFLRAAAALRRATGQPPDPNNPYT